ncbi:hypothetical protein EB796_011020 [Bugula neritina]|uniref:Uncharacterized protein n=1 Tax=Bugula neritina TaxID=10212 RepID=A0A7J7JWA2_BUGNE|nr:hypothetical protein EB796_011020 [Bugula neritina]
MISWWCSPIFSCLPVTTPSHFTSLCPVLLRQPAHLCTEIVKQHSYYSSESCGTATLTGIGKLYYNALNSGPSAQIPSPLFPLKEPNLTPPY